ncbi:amidase [Cupriavidus agavae]|uniref:Amidase n=1 Tax=Cupriavidus agavae TaxID=1001822 RepID=A0A4Q7RPH0_9BURK|nr:amidase [Cupriavidus agavae]RZT35546.1 amidase [Cupriavidus agavae]
MEHILDLSAREMAARLGRRDLSAEAVVRASLERIAELDVRIHAWQHVDPDAAIARARALDAGKVTGALHGVPIGVKDLMDTADMPTTYGSPIYAGHRPTLDAAAVALARSAGAIVVGKTVTTEFATFQPGPTCNPRALANAPCTPGGSSSGSAAAVAAGMVPLAFGTQTAGSIIRPAAYCGVVGYKPTHATLPLAGIKPLSPSLDTVGVLARRVDDAALFIGTLARNASIVDACGAASGSLRIGICRTPHWARASTDARAAIDTAAQSLAQLGATVQDFALPTACDALTEAQMDIMAFEALAAFAPEATGSSALFSAAFVRQLEAGRAVTGERFQAALATAELARMALAAALASFDAIIAPSAEGEAPAGLEATGDPIFCRMWTLLGTPCVHVPTGTGASGMPVGVTVTGPRHEDARVLAVAHRLQVALAGSSA